MYLNCKIQVSSSYLYCHLDHQTIYVVSTMVNTVIKVPTPTQTFKSRTFQGFPRLIASFKVPICHHLRNADEPRTTTVSIKQNFRTSPGKLYRGLQKEISQLCIQLQQLKIMWSFAFSITGQRKKTLIFINVFSETFKAKILPPQIYKLSGISRTYKSLTIMVISCLIGCSEIHVCSGQYKVIAAVDCELSPSSVSIYCHF